MSSVTNNFKTDVRDWVAFDNKIDKAKKVIQKVKEKKNDISQNIVQYMKARNLEKKEIKIQDTRLRCSTRTTQTPLTKKFIQGCLTEFLRDHHEAKRASDMIYNPKEKILACLTLFFGDEEKAGEATDYIFDRREKTVITQLVKKRQRAPVEVKAGPASERATRAMETPRGSEIDNDDHSDEPYDDQSEDEGYEGRSLVHRHVRG